MNFQGNSYGQDDKFRARALVHGWTWSRSMSGLPPEMGTEMAKNWDLASPGRGARKRNKWPENGSKMEFRAIFPLFGTIFPDSLGEAKICFSAIFVPGRGPKMDLYQVHGIAMDHALWPCFQGISVKTTEQAPKRNCVTKTLPNFRVNVLVRFLVSLVN